MSSHSLYRKSLALFILQIFLDPLAYGNAREGVPSQPNLKVQSLPSRPVVMQEQIRSFCVDAVNRGQIKGTVEGCVSMVTKMLSSVDDDPVIKCLNRPHPENWTLKQCLEQLATGPFKNMPSKVADETGLRDWLKCNARAKAGMDGNCNRYFEHRKASATSLETVRQMLLSMHNQSLSENEHREIRNAIFTVNQSIHTSYLRTADGYGTASAIKDN